MTKVHTPVNSIKPLAQSLAVVLARGTSNDLIRGVRFALMSVTCCGEQENRLKVGEFCDCNCHKE